ncbi:NAD(P)H-hydrate dehydratase [Ramlibacter sp. AN1015]|uniref:NAD(P)H-hydrate dehydratase n=1 Tax=Ramlibacter sp. AN1015 TaxID=3133428 RepID=UPI0030BFECEE
MHRIVPGRPWPLHDTAASRRVEAAAAAQLPQHALMQRAGLAVARLALALAPHARDVWLACGPGNNGGDGLEAAMHLKRWGGHPVVTWLGEPQRAPQDARASLQRAREAGVAFAEAPPPSWDLCVDALFGLGAQRPLSGPAAGWRDHMRAGARPVLAVDLPSGLDADTGTGEQPVRATHTLSLLTLKPGLFTGSGRDAAGEIWFDDLGVSPDIAAPTALLAGAPSRVPRRHASHKGSWGDVAVIGGAAGMRGAALLAARAALHAGAGRVFVCAPDGDGAGLDPASPELMFRGAADLDLSRMHVACGCGGGDAIRSLLPRVLSTAASLVLDADALNAMAADTALQVLLRSRAGRGRRTVITPHPLEAARLLACSTAEVQSDRLAAARVLAQAHGCVVVLKGSGSVIAGPENTAAINPTGNARLATAGTGDVLAGLLAARLAAGASAFDAAAGGVWEHGRVADDWPEAVPFTATRLAESFSPP